MALLIRFVPGGSVSSSSKTEWLVCVIELVGLVCCMAITTLLLANLIEKHLYYNQFKYTDECSTAKSSTEKRPIVSPWCLVLLRHRINTTQGRRQKRHTLPTLDFMHWKFNEPPAFVEPKFFGQRIRLKNLDVAPTWTNSRQARPLFETPGTQAQSFQHVDQLTHTPAPTANVYPILESNSQPPGNVYPSQEIQPSTATSANLPLIENSNLPPVASNTNLPSDTYPTSENAVLQHNRIFNHTSDAQTLVHSVESVMTTTYIAPTQPIPQEETTSVVSISQIIDNIPITPPHAVDVQPGSIVSSKINVPSQPVQITELQPSQISAATQVQEPLPPNDPLLTAVHESISDTVNPVPIRYIRYHL